MAGVQEVVLSQDLPGLKAGTRNNMCAFLDDSGRNAVGFEGIIKFLKRSRIHKAISTECPAFYSHQRNFWENAEVIVVDSKTIIKSRVLGREITVSSQKIREILDLDDSDEMTFKTNRYQVRGCFLRCGYNGNVETGVLNKSCLSIQYKYLAHVLQHCISSRKAGHDQLNEKIQGAFAALVLNAPYNFSGLILNYLVDNVTKKKDKYLMYARFLQLIINHQAPDLPKEDTDLIRLERMTDATFNRIKQFKLKEKPKDKRLVCHLVNEDYVCPSGKSWRHEDSDSDVEHLIVSSEKSDDDDEKEEQADDAEDINVEGFELRRRQKRGREEVAQGPAQKEKRIKFRIGQSVKTSQTTTEATSSGVNSQQSTPQTQLTFPPPTTTIVTPTKTTAPPVTVSPVVTSSLTGVTAENFHALSTMIVRLMADYHVIRNELTGQAETIQRQSETIQSQSNIIESIVAGSSQKDEEIARLNSEVTRLSGLVEQQEDEMKALTDKVNTQNMLLLTGSGDLRNQEERLKVVEDKLSAAGPSGVLRIKDIGSRRRKKKVVEVVSDDSEDSDVGASDDEDRTVSEEEAEAETSSHQGPQYVTPLQIDNRFRCVLDMQENLKHSVVYDAEEGEILHNLSEEQIGELMGLDQVQVESDKATSSDVPPLEILSDEDGDEVEIEDITAECYPTYQKDDEDLPSEMFNQSEDDLNRRCEEKTTARAESSEAVRADEEELKKLKQEWLEYVRGQKEIVKPALEPKYTKFYKIKSSRAAKGKIISWAYLKDLNVYAVKREQGIDYFKHPCDFKTLPYFELMQVARLKMLYCEEGGMSGWFQKQLRFEFKNGWKILKPQFPDIYRHKTKKNPNTGLPLKILKYKPVRYMKKVPIRKMRQDFCQRFKWWYYDDRSEEAVIVLGKDENNDCETVRIFDPMWLRNLSEEDIYVLYDSPILCKVENWEQAMQYQRVIRICYALDVHA